MNDFLKDKIIKSLKEKDYYEQLEKITKEDIVNFEKGIGNKLIMDLLRFLSNSVAVAEIESVRIESPFQLSLNANYFLLYVNGNEFSGMSEKDFREIFLFSENHYLKDDELTLELSSIRILKELKKG